MLATRKLMAFVATTDPARAKAFYEGTLGLPLLSEDPFALVFSAAGVVLRVQKTEKHAPLPSTVLGWSVPDVPAAARELASRGVPFERYPGMGQDADGVWSSPSGAKVAWFKDPDGNVLSLSDAGSP